MLFLKSAESCVNLIVLKIVSVYNWNYITTDAMITLIIYFIFSMIIKLTLFNLN